MPKSVQVAMGTIVCIIIVHLVSIIVPGAECLSEFCLETSKMFLD